MRFVRRYSRAILLNIAYENLTRNLNSVCRLLFRGLREGKCSNGLEGKGRNVESSHPVDAVLRSWCLFIENEARVERRKNWVKAVTRISRIGSSARRRPGKRRRVDVPPPGLGEGSGFHTFYTQRRPPVLYIDFPLLFPFAQDSAFLYRFSRVDSTTRRYATPTSFF